MSDLSKAIDNDSLAKVKSLVKDGIDLNKGILIGEEYELEDYDEISPLFYAIRKHACIEMIEHILQNGVNLFDVDSDGISALDIAIKFKRFDVITLCINSGFDLNSTKRKSGMTPIMLVSCSSNIKMMQLLLDSGAKLDIHDKNGMSPKDYAKKLGQKSMVEFLETQGAKHSLYPEES